LRKNALRHLAELRGAQDISSFLYITILRTGYILFIVVSDADKLHPIFRICVIVASETLSLAHMSIIKKRFKCKSSFSRWNNTPPLMMLLLPKVIQCQSRWEIRSNCVHPQNKNITCETLFGISHAKETGEDDAA